MATASGLNGDSPFAISSALTNSRHSNKLGNTEYEAVVFPAPLHPAIMYNVGVIYLNSKKSRKQYCLRDLVNLAERPRFELGIPFWGIHAFQ